MIGINVPHLIEILHKIYLILSHFFFVLNATITQEIVLIVIILVFIFEKLNWTILLKGRVHVE